jgi:hypothetical protein
LRHKHTAHTAHAVALAVAIAAIAAPPAQCQTDSLGVTEARTWLIDSLPRVASFTLHDRLNGQPISETTRTLAGVRVDGCAMSWSVVTVSGKDSTHILLTAQLQAVDPSLATALIRDTVHTPAGRLTHDPPVWEVTAPTRDGSSAERLESQATHLKIDLKTIDLFVSARDDAWRTAAAIAAVARACQAK